MQLPAKSPTKSAIQKKATIHLNAQFAIFDSRVECEERISCETIFFLLGQILKYLILGLSFNCLENLAKLKVDIMAESRNLAKSEKCEICSSLHSIFF